LPIDREGEEVPEPHRFERHLLYRLSGVSILVAMLAMGVYFALPGGWKETADLYNALYVLESIAIWSYAGAWLLKGRFMLAKRLIFQDQLLLEIRHNRLQFSGVEAAEIGCIGEGVGLRFHRGIIPKPKRQHPPFWLSQGFIVQGFMALQQSNIIAIQ